MKRVIQKGVGLALALVLMTAPAFATDGQDTLPMEAGTGLSLTQAVDLALANNPDLKAAGRQTLAGQMDVKEAVSSLYPQVGTGISGRKIHDDDASGLTDTAENAWAISARVSQVLYSDAAFTRVKTSRHLQQVLKLSENQTRLDLILDTSQAYLNMLSARADARIRLTNLELIESNLTLARNRYRAGYSAQTDALRLESEAATARAGYMHAQAGWKRARINLNRLLNRDIDTETTILDLRLDDPLFLIHDPVVRAALTPDNPGGFNRLAEAMVSQGKAASLELRSIDRQIMVQTAAYDLARRSYWSPTLSLDGSLSNTVHESGAGSSFRTVSLPGGTGSLEDPGDTHWEIALNLSLPLYQGGAKSARKIRALETRNQLTLFRQEVQNRVSENIQGALLRMSASYPAIALHRTSARAARENLEMVQENYSKGYVSIVKFLDAQNAALVAGISAESAVYDFFMDLFACERAAGQFSMYMTAAEKKEWISGVAP